MTEHQASRRTMLGLLGAATAVAGGAVAVTRPGAAAARIGEPAARPERIPPSLRPGGELDQSIAELAAADRFSGTVLLKHRGRTVLSRSHGMANKEAGIPNGPDTAFMLASITKMFTGVAIAQLVQAGDVAYDEKLGTYLDGFQPEIAENVTIHQLLTHTSGMGDFHRIRDYMQVSRTWTSAEEVMDGTMAYIRSVDLEFPPGAGYFYSNSGYATLGAIVASVSGQSYYDYVQHHVFEAAGMSGAGFPTRPEVRDDPGTARPYAPPEPGQPRVDTIEHQDFIGLPAGGAFARAEDLVAFTEALMGDDLLEPAHAHIVTTPKVPPPHQPGPELECYFDAYAPAFGILGGQRVLGHAGDQTGGASVSVDWFPDSGWVAVILSNYEGGTRVPVVEQTRRLITEG